MSGGSATATAPAAAAPLAAPVVAIETKLDEVAKTVEQVKYDTTKLRGRLNRVDLEDLRSDVDAIKATLGLE